MTWVRIGKMTVTVIVSLLMFSVQRIALLTFGVEWMEWTYEQMVGIVIFGFLMWAIWR